MIEVIESKPTYEDENGEGYVVTMKIATGGASVKRVIEWLEDNYPSESCTHDYDCCANFYPNLARVTFSDGSIAKAQQRFYLNI